ncbi:MAG: MFS transporter [Candidatus Bathyarchaeia archaeon]|nr:MFS transporter [Candidatus Bathyarchaeia archaeon]
MASHTKNAKDSIFWMLCIMGLFAILSSTMSKSPVLKPFSLSLGTPTDLTGFVAAASTIPGILVSLPAASLSDIYGRKKFLLIAGFVFASAPFLYLLITVWWQLIPVRFYHGFATAIFVPVAEASIAELCPTKRGERISLFSSMTNVGRLIAPILGGYVLLITSDNFRMLYSAVAVAGVTALITALPFVAEKKQPIITQQGNAKEIVKRMFCGWKAVAKSRGVLVVSFVQACQYYAYGAAEFYLAGYLPEIVHLNKFLTGVIITSIIGVAIFAKPYMGRVSDKIGRRIPIVLGCIVSALPLLAIPFVTDFWILLLLVVVYGFGFTTVTASTPALMSELVPKELIGTSMGFLGTIMDVGQTLGPIISGLILATNLQYYGVFPSLTFVLLFSCIIFVLSGVAKSTFK